MSKKVILLIILTVILFLFCSAHSWGTQFRSARHISISEDEVIEGDLFVGGGIITIDGVITGDLFFGCNTININGEVKGDIIGMAASFTLNGTAGDDVRVWCRSVNINGLIAKSLTAFGQDVVLSKQSIVKRDAIVGCTEAMLEGGILGEIWSGSKILQLSGVVGKQAEFGAKQIIIRPSAEIHGNLKYRAKKIEIMDGASIEGKIEKLPPKKKKSKWLSWKFYVLKMIYMIGAILVGIVMIKLSPDLTIKVTKQVRQYWRSLGVGFVVLICLPIALILVAATVIGIPLAVILLIFYLLFLYTGKIFVSLVIGQEILKSRESASIWALILGIVIFTVLFNIPYVGWLIKLLVMILGLGALSLISIQAIKRA